VRILVTGCAGFIGFHVVKRLLKEGHHIMGVDNLNDYYDVLLKQNRLKCLKNKNFTFKKLHLQNKNAVNKIFTAWRPNIVIHLAAQAGIRYSFKDPHAYITSNLVGFTNVVEACCHNNIEHLLYASSSSVYGSNAKLPLSTKDNTDHPLSLYAATKKANELMAHTYSNLYGLPTTGLRFFTVYGPWGRPDMSLFLFTKAILERETIKIFNNGNMKRDFTYIDDVVESIVQLMYKKPQSNSEWNRIYPDSSTSHAPYKIYNIGNNNPVNLMDFIKVIENKLQLQAKKAFLPLQLGDVIETYADITDLITEIGFKPKTSIEEGIHHFIDWYKDYYDVH